MTPYYFRHILIVLFLINGLSFSKSLTSKIISAAKKTNFELKTDSVTVTVDNPLSKITQLDSVLFSPIEKFVEKTASKEMMYLNYLSNILPTGESRGYFHTVMSQVSGREHNIDSTCHDLSLDINTAVPLVELGNTIMTRNDKIKAQMDINQKCENFILKLLDARDSVAERYTFIHKDDTLSNVHSAQHEEPLIVHDPIADSISQYEKTMNFSYDPKSLAHNARKIPQLYPIEYEYHGHKARVTTGATILNSTGVQILNGHTNNYEEYPLLLAGTWSRSEYSFDASTLNLHGQNGMLILDNPQKMQDTTTVKINWIRGPASGNHFDLEFKRLLTDSIMFEFYGKSNSTDSTAKWSYANQAHQIYLATMQRDSSTIPFSGRNLKINNQTLSPSITFYLPNLILQTYFNYFYDKSDDAPNLEPVIDTLDNRYLASSFTAFGYQSKLKEKRYGANLKTHLLSSDITLHGSLTQMESSYSLPNELKGSYILLETNNITRYPSERLEFYRDSLGFNDIDESTTTEQTFSNVSVSIKPELPWFPSLYYQNEYQTVSNYLPYSPEFRTSPTTLSHYKELGYLEQDLSLFSIDSHRMQAGFSRNIIQGRSFLSPSISYDLTLNTNPVDPFFSLHGYYNYYHRAPSLKHLYMYNAARVSIPSPTLTPEKIQVVAADATVKRWGVTLTGGLRGEYVRDYIASTAYGSDSLITDTLLFEIRDEKYNELQYDTLTFTDKEDSIIVKTDTSFTYIVHDTIAFSQKNYGYAESVIAHMGAGFTLGNWAFYLERQIQLSNSLSGAKLQDYLDHIYSRNYKGHIIWTNAFVNDKLGLQIKWEWEWFNNRYTWARSKTQYAKRVQLNHYLVMDFEARMKISSFQLYLRIDNFNHSKYTTDIGYTPWGLTFKYGIQWNFSN